MPRTLSQIRKEWIQIIEDLKAYENNPDQDINAVRRSVRDKMLCEQDIDMNNQLEILLKKEYELEQEENRMNVTLEMIDQGKNIRSPKSQHELEKRLIKKQLDSFDKNEVETRRKEIIQKVVLQEEIDKDDALGHLLAKEFTHDRALERLDIEEKSIRRGYVKGSQALKNFVDLRMMIEDKFRLDPQILEQQENDFKAKKNNGEEIDLNNTYFRFLQNEMDLTERVKSFAEAEREKQRQEEIRQEELNRRAAEAEAEAAQRNPEPEKRKPFEIFTKIANLFRRTPKEAPTVIEPVKEDVTQKKAEQEEVKQEPEKKETDKEVTADIQVEDIQQEILDEEKRRQEKIKLEEEERAKKYRAEFAGKELIPEIRNCGDPKILADYLDKTTTLKPEVQEHLKARVLANAKIQSLEESRAMIQKNRPPAVKYKDGTILLKNKKKDVPKQSTLNGCWSAVLSDMLGHFGVDLSQEEIRAYRPQLQSGNLNEPNALMDRLNSDSMNEINDMADLIQRTVPNVAHHHMSLGANIKENKAVLQETVADALLNKNSPVAVLYGNHYLSIVGIKDDTLIVQNPAVGFDSKYQRLSIDDLFEGCNSKNGMGQVTIDWLEDLKFDKNGNCKNINEQWKSMGIKCSGREFKKGGKNNYDSHVRGYEFSDDTRIMKGIEETIYLPQMSFGKEKGIMNAKIKEKQQDNINKGIMNKEFMEKYEKQQVIDMPEIEREEMTLDSFSAL